MTSGAPIRAVIFGASGRMGRELVARLAVEQGVAYAGAVGRDPESVARRLAYRPDGRPLGLQELLAGTQVAIDFSLPEAVDTHLALCVEHRLPYVCGVTALSERTQAALDEASRSLPVLWAPNMSQGVNLCFASAEDLARRLTGAFAVTIHDIHHAHKQDAPSGTALEFGRLIRAAAQAPVTIDYTHVREGEHPGEHHVRFDCGEERIELRHRAGTRSEFVRGAVQAAQWLAGQSPGLFNMRNVLGITTSS